MTVSSMDLHNFNPYAIMGLAERGPQASIEEIRTAYKKLSLKKHPDKQRDNPNAAQEFDELKRARDVLLEPSARAALDDVIRAQARTAERVGQQDAKRQKMRQELERRERSEGTARSELELAQLRLKKELETLRAKAAQRERARAQERATATAAAAMASSSSTRHAGAPAPAAQPAQPAGAQCAAAAAAAQAQLLARTLRATWSIDARDYDAAALRSLFSGVAAVDDVRIFPSKKRGRGSGLVVMATPAGAALAAGASLGGEAAPLQVKPVPAADKLPDLPLAGAAAQSSASASGTPLTANAAAVQESSHTAPPGSTAPPVTPGMGSPLFPCGATSGLFGTFNSARPPDALGTNEARASACSSFPASAPSSFPSPGLSSFPPATQPGASLPASFPAMSQAVPTATTPDTDGAPTLAGVSRRTWNAALERNRSEEVRRLSQRAELLARLQADEEVDA